MEAFYSNMSYQDQGAGGDPSLPPIKYPPGFEKPSVSSGKNGLITDSFLQNGHENYVTKSSVEKPSEDPQLSFLSKLQEFVIGRNPGSDILNSPPSDMMVNKRTGNHLLEGVQESPLVLQCSAAEYVEEEVISSSVEKFVTIPSMETGFVANASSRQFANGAEIEVEEVQMDVLNSEQFVDKNYLDLRESGPSYSNEGHKMMCNPMEFININDRINSNTNETDPLKNAIDLSQAGENLMKAGLSSDVGADIDQIMDDDDLLGQNIDKSLLTDSKSNYNPLDLFNMNPPIFPETVLYYYQPLLDYLTNNVDLPPTSEAALNLNDDLPCPPPPTTPVIIDQEMEAAQFNPETELEETVVETEPPLCNPMEFVNVPFQQPPIIENYPDCSENILDLSRGNSTSEIKVTSPVAEEQVQEEPKEARSPPYSPSSILTNDFGNKDSTLNDSTEKDPDSTSPTPEGTQEQKEESKTVVAKPSKKPPRKMEGGLKLTICEPGSKLTCHELEICNIFQCTILLPGKHETSVKKLLGDTPWAVNLSAGKPVYQCRKCKTYTNVWDLYLKHNRICCKGKPYICQTCKRKFPLKYTLKMHAAQHKDSQAHKSVKCDHCDESFPNYSSLVKHKKRHARIKLHRCKACGEDFLTPGGLRKHGRTRHRKRDLKERTCKICKIAFASRHTLRIHLACHGRKMQFLCPECNEFFRSKSDLYKHQKDDHIQQYTTPIQSELIPIFGVQCADCGMNLANNETLKEHLLNQCDKRTFLCAECADMCRGRDAFKKHVKQHKAFKFECVLCDASFRKRSVYVNHLFSHGGLRPYTCRYCKLSFTQKVHLNAHKIEYSQRAKFKCRNCGTSFETEEEHNTHFLRYSVRSPYTCVYCDRQFKYQCTLIQHQRAIHGKHLTAANKKKQLRRRKSNKAFNSETRSPCSNALNMDDPNQLLSQYSIIPELWQYIASAPPEPNPLLATQNELLANPQQFLQGPINMETLPYLPINFMYEPGPDYSAATPLPPAYSSDSFYPACEILGMYPGELARQVLDPTSLASQQNIEMPSSSAYQNPRSQAEPITKESLQEIQMQFSDAPAEIQQLCLNRGLFQRQQNPGTLVIYQIQLNQDSNGNEK